MLVRSFWHNVAQSHWVVNTPIGTVHHTLQDEPNPRQLIAVAHALAMRDIDANYKRNTPNHLPCASLRSIMEAC